MAITLLFKQKISGPFFSKYVKFEKTDRLSLS
ncbi:hypothetical protein EDC46_0338 [Vespertiliibacter pulmonis]|uniref:Uncharacterized protein n=1 Tax=Vespertiliibacter pulmonis TaxID=1443036 RepID=A0A3N4W0S3_9PAST|nr:hypothetical protein EDC46_0338 [Vespertiliibacter pulmonis]